LDGELLRGRDEVHELLGQRIDPGIGVGRQGYALLAK